MRKAFLCNRARRYAQETKKLHLPHATVHALHTKVYVYLRTNCSCGTISNQPTVKRRRDFVGKCCRKLTMTRFSWTLCVFF
jgi:hypothetical protein